MMIKLPCHDCIHKEVCKIRDHIFDHGITEGSNTNLSLSCSVKKEKEQPPKKGVLGI